MTSPFSIDAEAAKTDSAVAAYAAVYRQVSALMDSITQPSKPTTDPYRELSSACLDVAALVQWPNEARGDNADLQRGLLRVSAAIRAVVPTEIPAEARRGDE